MRAWMDASEFVIRDSSSSSGIGSIDRSNQSINQSIEAINQILVLFCFRSSRAVAHVGRNALRTIGTYVCVHRSIRVRVRYGTERHTVGVVVVVVVIVGSSHLISSHSLESQPTFFRSLVELDDDDVVVVDVDCERTPNGARRGIARDLSPSRGIAYRRRCAYDGRRRHRWHR